MSPQNTTPNTCLFQPGFSCYTFKVGNVTGSLELDFGQATGKSILVTGISCSQNATAALHTSPLAEDITVPSGEHRWIAGGTSNNSGIICEGATGVAGSRYKGTVCVNYIESDANAQRLICGDINARLEPASIPRGSPTTTPYPTPPLGATPITDCSSSPIIISSPGYYYLNSSLTSSGNNCIEITADASNSILDCYGHSITGTPYSGAGIYLQATTGVTLRHCVVSTFYQGILLGPSSTGNIITDNTASSNQHGIFLQSANGNTITGNIANSNGDTGIYFFSSSDNNLTGNNALANNGYGIYTDGNSANNLFTGNAACWNRNQDVHCDVSQSEGNDNICMPYEETVCSGSITCNPVCPAPPAPACAPGFVVSSCDCVLNVPGNYTLESDLNETQGGDCIDIIANDSNLDCQHHSITSQSGGTGIMIVNWNTYSISGVSVENCNASNLSYGIYAYGVYNSTITDNIASANQYGIFIQSSSGNIISGNTANSNPNTNIYLSSATDNNLTGNTALASINGYGVYADGSSSNNLLTENSACWNQYGDVYCDAPQTEGNGNICMPYEGTACLDSITCNPTCPSPSPPDCAPGWVVSSCGCTLNMPGNYTLESDLNSTGGDCIDITANGANLDCQHHSITTQGGGNGIMIANWNTGSISEVSVENCNPSNFSVGIYAYGLSGGNMSGNTASANSEGMMLQNSNGIEITGNTASSNSDVGILLSSSSDNNLTGNHATGNNGIGGIYADSGSSNNLLTDNTACWNTYYGIYCDAPQTEGNGNICMPYGETACLGSITCNSECPPPEPPACAPDWVVNSCSCILGVPGDYTLDSDLHYSDYSDCIDLYSGASGSTLDCQGHSITGVPGMGQGIALWSNNITVRNCNLANFSNGIVAFTTHGSSIIGNNVSSTDYGISLWSSSTNDTIAGNNASFNIFGITLSSSSGNNFTDNIAMNNTATGNSFADFYCISSDSNGDYGNVCETQAGCESWLGCGLMPACSSSITECCVINSTGSYSLADDISAAGDCISILPGANGATLDCGGKTITGPGNSGNGIQLFGTSGVTVENCGVSGFMYGISLSSANGNAITGNNASSNGQIGILMSASNGNDITGNTANSDYSGISMSYSDGNTITGNTVSNGNSNGQGIIMSQCDGNAITGNTVTLNYYGIYLSYSTDNTISGNIANSNHFGIEIEYSSYNNTVTGNTACWSGELNKNIYCDVAQNDGGGNICAPEGPNTVCSHNVSCGSGCPPPLPPSCAPGWVISTCPCTIGVPESYTLDSDINYTNPSGGTCITVSAGASGATINCQDHNITGSGSGFGISLYSVNGISVENCKVSNFSKGIYLSYANGNTLTNNIASSNHDTGIMIEGSNNNTFTGNTANQNTYEGMYLQYGSTNNNFTGNTAIGNSDYDFICNSLNSNNDLGGNVCSNRDSCGPNPPYWLNCTAP